MMRLRGGSWTTAAAERPSRNPAPPTLIPFPETDRHRMLQPILSRYLVLALSTLVASGCSPLSAAADDAGETVRSAVARVDPSVVRIRAIGAAVDDAAAGTEAVSTGVVVSTEGLILTSAWALRGNPQAVLVRTADGRRVDAAIVATDFLRNLVLLRASGEDWQPATGVPPEDVRVGQYAIAIGRVLSAERSSLSMGIISGRKRVHGLALQTDAKVSPVNYGGPLIDLDGRVLGILVPLSPQGRDDVSAGVEWYDSGIGFAIPFDEARQAASRLQTDGDQYPGQLGVTIETGSPLSGPVTVTAVAPGGPADAAGLRAGDQLQMVNGEPIERAGHLEAVLGRSYAGDPLTIDILRDGGAVSVTAELVRQLPPVQRGYLGLLPLAAVDSGTDHAAMSLLVLPDSPAAASGLSGRIVCGRLDTQPVDSLPNLLAAATPLRSGESAALGLRPDDGDSVTLEDVAVTPGTEPLRLPQWPGHVQDEFRSLRDQPSDRAGDRRVSRDELTVGDEGRCIVFRPVRDEAAPDTGRQPGVVVLLSDRPENEVQVLQDWTSLMHSHDLMVVMPVNPEGSLLSETDIPLIRRSLAVVHEASPFERLRVVAVAERGQTGLAAGLALQPRSPVFGAALLGGWFRPPAGFDAGRTRRSILLLQPPEDTESRVLWDQSAESLRSGGVRVFEQPQDAEETTQEQLIADWTLMLIAV